MKTCTMCHKEKPESEFGKRIMSRDGLNSRCKRCVAANGKEKHRKQREYLSALSADQRKDFNLRMHYKMTLAEFDERLAAQGGICAICGRSPDDFRRAFAVDHDHKTGVIRGIVCPDCNRGLGGFGDSLATLENAVEYLKKSAQDNS